MVSGIGRPPTRLRLVTSALIACLALGGLALISWQINLFDVRASSPWASVATAFDPPPSYPGYRWTLNGRPAPPDELVTVAGPAHCGWQSATFLTIGWPPGTVSATAEHARQYLRDPTGVLGATYWQQLVLHAALPKDAHSTGYRYGSLEVYLSPSDQDQAIYVVAPSGAERWPRSDPMTLCV